MSCHLVGLSSDAELRLAGEIHFRGVRRTAGEIAAYGAPGPSLGDAYVDCQLGVAPKPGAECLTCPRLLAWHFGPSARDITLECVWTHADPVSARMTCRNALVSVPPSIECRAADRVAAREGVHRLLIIDGGELVGVVCRHDLQIWPGDRVALHMCRRVYVISAAATLGEAAAAMHTLDIACLPVVRDWRLVGIITRGDLVRAGLPAELLAG
jgi:CBS domain-containing protein